MKKQFQITLSSFGFKYGLPAEATLVWDVRFLTNPYWVEEMRPKTGLDGEVAAYVLQSPAAIEFFRLIKPLLAFVVQENISAGKTEMWLAVGCTGGQHRSVAVVEALRPLFASEEIDISVLHRDMPRDIKRSSAAW